MALLPGKSSATLPATGVFAAFRMRHFLMRAALALLVPAAARADDSPPGSAAKPEKGGGFFSWLLPKSLQKNPRLDFNILTEVTREGRKEPIPNLKHPAYYISKSGGMHNEGLVSGEDHLNPPSEEQLQRVIEKALTERGYQVSDATHPPTLAIIYQYGSHTFNPPAPLTDPLPAGANAPPPDPAGTGDVPVPEDQVRRTLLTRALLLGGAKFAADVAAAMESVDTIATQQNVFVAPQGGDFMNSPAAGLSDPFDDLRARSTEMARLVDELFSSSYFVTASAYDYAELAKGRRRLLWRTKMTVNSLGVGMGESVPSLIASAAPYFGREMSDPIVISKRISREGQVDIGTATVQADPEPAKTVTPPEQPEVKKSDGH
jgi:hypothetical protein